MLFFTHMMFPFQFSRQDSLPEYVRISNRISQSFVCFTILFCHGDLDWVAAISRLLLICCCLSFVTFAEAYLYSKALLLI